MKCEIPNLLSLFRTPARPSLTTGWPSGVAVRSFAILLAVALSATASAPPLRGEELLRFTGSTMGTSYSIVARAPSEEIDAESLHAAIDRRLERVNDQMSTWRPDSELSRFNQYPETDWFEISAETAAVVAEAIRISRESDGAFDVTVGPLVNLWKFGAERPTAYPTDAEIADALERVGYEKLDVQFEPPAVRKSRPDIYVDLSGIAKGFGVDQVAELFHASGLHDYLIEIGGEIRTRGKKPDGSVWRVGIEAPTVDRRILQRTLELSDRSLASSGDYRNFWEADGRRLSHTIDPRTGRPVESELTSVTVITDTCMEADAVATALMVLGPEAAYDWASQRDMAVLLIVRQAGRFVERPTPLFSQLYPVPTAPRGQPMQTFLLALLIFAIAIAAMAVGLLGRRRLRGTCGGLANVSDSAGRPMCDACESPSPSCRGVEEGRQRATEHESESDLKPH